jgi:hypothetical protein
LIRTLQQTGKIFHISFTGGGEPFLVSNLISACTEITKNHYISFITNLTSKRVREFVNAINPAKVRSILASAHIEELQRRGLLTTYIENFLLCRENGFNIRACEVAFPPLADKVPQFRELFEKRGIELTFDPFCGVIDGKKYPDAYTDHELRIFNLNAEEDIAKFRQRGKICNAGFNLGLVWPDGTIHPCYQIKEVIGNIYHKITLREELIRCPFLFCACPLNVYDPHLFHRALQMNPKVSNPAFLLWQDQIKFSVKRLCKKIFGSGSS